MTEREKIIKAIDGWANKAVQSNGFDGASVYNPHNAAELADTLIAAGFRDVDDRGTIFMNGEAIVPTPDVYNKVAELLGCPLMLDVPDKRRVFSDGTIENDDKRRAEVAELALKNACYNIERSNIRERYQGVNPFAVERLQRLFIKHAERQLREQRDHLGR